MGTIWHGLLEYAVLEEKAAAATTRHNELSAQIKAAETRMAEIAVLRTHIINYVKTREVYAAYRKAGYSKKFLAGHEADILLHKAAKQAFDDLGIKKLPTVKSLQAEYDDFAETIERIHDVFPVCFCAIHRNFPLSPTWGGAWFIVAILYCSLS